MTCTTCQQKINQKLPPLNIAPEPCTPCAMEHLKRAKESEKAGNVFRTVWHLARIAQFAPQTQTAIKDARIKYQIKKQPINWKELQEILQ